MTSSHYESIRSQFSIRIPTYEKAANWMLNPELIRAHIDLVEPVQKGKCLELCCGTGIMGKAFQKAGWEVEGIDLTFEMAEYTSKFFPARVGSIEKMPFDDECFDLAVLRQAFMLVDGDKALAEIFRVLKPGGVFLLSQSVSFSSEDDAQYEKVQWARHINMTRYYRTGDLDEILRRNGFAVEGWKHLKLRESVTHWLNSAPELGPDLRQEIHDLIASAPEGYKRIRNVEERDGELFEDWNWAVVKAVKLE